MPNFQAKLHIVLAIRKGQRKLVDVIFEIVRQHGTSAPAGISKLTAETGSSVATALGAGLAVLVIYCARIAQATGTVGLTSVDV